MKTTESKNSLLHRIDDVFVKGWLHELCCFNNTFKDANGIANEKEPE